MTAPQPVSVLIAGRVVDLAMRDGDTVQLPQGTGPWLTVPWRFVERWRPRASYHVYGTAPWQDGPAAAPTPPDR